MSRAAAGGARPQSRWLVLGLVAAGALFTASFAPLGWWWVQAPALSLLVASITRARPRRAALLGAAFGFGWLASGWWWLHISLHDHGGLAWGLSAAAVAVLAAAMALYLAAACAAFAAWRTNRPGWDTALFAALWLLAELARGSFFTGFPWSAAGYAHTSGPLAALAPWVGVYGIGAVVAAFGAWLAFGWMSLVKASRPGFSRPPAQADELQHGPGAVRGWALAGAALAAVVLAPYAGPREFSTPAGSLRASLVQPAVPQDLKFDEHLMRRNLDDLQEQILAAQAPLVVAPESVIPIPQALLPLEDWQRLREPFLTPQRGLLLGIFLGNEAEGYVNSMVGLSLSASPEPTTFYAYGKRHLLPFGEFIPPGFGWFVRLLDIPLGDQARGTHARPFEVAGQRLRPLICYEDLFAEELVDSIMGPQAATVFVNASNLAWFGHRLVQDQHLQFSQMRALEFERPFLRATNTGATAALDHRGRVLARLPPLARATLDVEVEGRTGVTPFARWLAAFGLAPLWVLALAVCAMAFMRALRQRSRSALG